MIDLNQSEVNDFRNKEQEINTVKIIVRKGIWVDNKDIYVDSGL